MICLIVVMTQIVWISITSLSHMLVSLWHCVFMLILFMHSPTFEQVCLWADVCMLDDTYFMDLMVLRMTQTLLAVWFWDGLVNVVSLTSHELFTSTPQLSGLTTSSDQSPVCPVSQTFGSSMSQSYASQPFASQSLWSTLHTSVTPLMLVTLYSLTCNCCLTVSCQLMQALMIFITGPVSHDQLTVWVLMCAVTFLSAICLWVPHVLTCCVGIQVYIHTPMATLASCCQTVPHPHSQSQVCEVWWCQICPLICPVQMLDWLAHHPMTQAIAQPTTDYSWLMPFNSLWTLRFWVNSFWRDLYQVPL